MRQVSSYIEVIPYLDEWLLWNKLNGCLLSMEKGYILEKESGLFFSDKAKIFFDYLDKTMFFVSDEHVRDVIKKNAEAKKDFHDIFIVISTTEKCNCTCDYCYQCTWETDDSISDEEYYNVFMNYFRDLIVQMPKKDNRVTIRFFGGEPLLKKNLVSKIVFGIKELVGRSQKEVAVYYELDSNCLLLTRDVIKEFDNLSVTTSLSLPEDHNKHRSKTFSKTMERILEVKDLFEEPQYALEISYNMHQNNIEFFESFLQLLKKNNLNCNVYTSNIVNYENTLFYNELSDLEYEAFYQDSIIPLLLKYGYQPDNMLPRYGLERSCHALNTLNRKFYSNGKWTICSFFDRKGNPIRNNGKPEDIFSLPSMCIKCYDYPYCGGKNPCIICNGTYRYKDLMRRRIVEYVKGTL